MSKYISRSYWEIDVCPDCIYVAANGAPDYEIYTSTGHFYRYVQGLEKWGSEPFTDQDSPSFSWAACEFCGDTLGGDRYTAAVIQEAAHDRA
jgi:hypothetical protein